MKWLVLVCLAVGCQRASTPEPVDDRYIKDVSNICDVMQLSGATGMKGADARYTTAMWFGSHLATEQAHKFMIEIQPLVGEAKAQALETEAHRVGLTDCPLAAEWRR